MKRPVLFFLSWLLPLLLSADFVKWMGRYDTARHKALCEHKPLLVLVVKKEDAFSRKIVRDIFMGQPYVKKINREWVPVIVTYEGRSGYPVEMYYTTVFPTLFFVNAPKELFSAPPLYGREISQESVELSLKNVRDL